MATRTTTTSRAGQPRARSADHSDADFSFEELVVAYFDCRQHKRNTPSALKFEQNLERNLIDLYNELADGNYSPGRSICFIVTRPKPREVWAADFRDRIVHHLMYNRVGPRFLMSFIADSCACIPGRGTLYAVQRLESKVRSITENWSRPAWYLKVDLANFFVSIDKTILYRQLAAKIDEPFWLALMETILFHDPRADYELRGSPELQRLVPPHKRLCNQPAHLGLPIGNHSSQFFANVYLNAADQFAKHALGMRRYLRYVDDIVMLNSERERLVTAHSALGTFFERELNVRINPAKTIIQPVDRGIDFVGQVVRPWCTRTRRRTVRQGIRRIEQLDREDLYASANSYFGLFGQASSSLRDRAALARALLRRGHCVNGALTKTFRQSKHSSQKAAHV